MILKMILRANFLTAVQVGNILRSKMWISLNPLSAAAEVPIGVVGTTPGKLGQTKWNHVGM